MAEVAKTLRPADRGDYGGWPTLERPNVSFSGKYYAAEAKLCDPPTKPIPLLTGDKREKVYAPRRPTWRWPDYEFVQLDEIQVGVGGWRPRGGKNSTEMPTLIEQFVAAGDRQAPGRLQNPGASHPPLVSLCTVPDPAISNAKPVPNSDR